MFRCLLLVVIILAAINTHGKEPAPGKIDELLEGVWREQSLQPAPLCSDEQFLRRAMLDFVGRIPTLAERREFLAKPDRPALIDRLLASEEFARNCADVWTTQLYGYAENSVDRETLREWLREQIQTQRPYDVIVQQLISSTGESAFDGSANFLLRYPDEPVVKVSRAFLGVRLDCARCHDHPFDRWTQENFKQMNRFFEAMERRDVSAGNVRLVDVVRQVEAAERPRFLTGAQPKTNQWRMEFGLFLIKSRPFARNFANRIWHHLLGRGIVHPVDDMNRENLAAAPALLEWLADEARQSNFDIRHMFRTIAQSRAYQLGSASDRTDEGPRKYFAVRTMKPLTPEQSYASMCVALDRAQKPEEEAEYVRTYYGDALDGDFSSLWEYRETVQGLMARLVEDVRPPSSSTDELFLRILSREPTANERTLLKQRTAREICFVLLHSNEFAFQH